MGLNVSYGCWNGSYSSFNRFREAVAAAANIPLPIMDGFHDDAVEFLRSNDGVLARALVKCVPLKWDTLAPDPIHALLNHSDCDGIIEARYTLPLAVRLEDLATAMKGTRGANDLRDHADDAFAFAAGCRKANAAGECLTFS